jgi:hypothetical protein
MKPELNHSIAMSLELAVREASRRMSLDEFCGHARDLWRRLNGEEAPADGINPAHIVRYEIVAKKGLRGTLRSPSLIKATTDRDRAQAILERSRSALRNYTKIVLVAKLRDGTEREIQA